jgi:predicted RNase H-like HicB family nuclease
MAIRFYRAILADGGDYVTVLFPDLPGCISQGDDIQNAAAMGQEALALHVEALVAEGDELPEPTELGSGVPADMLEDIGNAPYRETLLPVELPSKPMKVTISLPTELVSSVDRMANRQGMTRSGYLARAAKQVMDLDKRDEMTAEQHNEQIRKELEQAFLPLRCVARIWDYGVRIKFRVFDEQDNMLFEEPELILRHLRQAGALEQVIDKARNAIRKGGVVFA